MQEQGQEHGTASNEDMARTVTGHGKDRVKDIAIKRTLQGQWQGHKRMRKLQGQGGGHCRDREDNIPRTGKSTRNGRDEDTENLRICDMGTGTCNQ